MPDSEEAIERLLDAITAAICMMERQNYGMALKRLRRAKYETEKLFAETEESPT
jgi:hypothetical protein